MYQRAAKRLIHGASLVRHGTGRLRLLPHLHSLKNGHQFSSLNSESPINESANQSLKPETLNFSGSTSSTSSSNFSASSTAEEARRHERKGPRADYEDEQARVLQASLPHVIRLGWTEAAMIAGAKDVGLSPSIVGSFPRKEAALVEFFMDDCLQRLIDKIDSGEELNSLIPSERISKLVRLRLEMQAPYISKWPQALSIQAQPLNVPISFKQRAMLVDEIWHAVGDEASAIDWYVKRTLLGGIYSTTEVYMLTDSSPGAVVFSSLHFTGVLEVSDIGRHGSNKLVSKLAWSLGPVWPCFCCLSITSWSNAGPVVGVATHEGRVVNDHLNTSWAFNLIV